VAAAFQAMYALETSCAVQLRAQAAGTIADGDLIEIPNAIVRLGAEQARRATLGTAPGTLIWPGLLRRLDRIDDSWRH
jgi:hypothetical protein